MGHLTKVLNPSGKKKTNNWFAKKAKILGHNISELRIVRHEDSLQHYSANKNQGRILHESIKLAKLYAKQGNFKEAFEKQRTAFDKEKSLGKQKNTTEAYLLVYKAIVYEAKANSSKNSDLAMQFMGMAGQYMDKATGLFLKKRKHKKAIETGRKAGDFYASAGLRRLAFYSYRDAANTSSENKGNFRALEIYSLALKHANPDGQEKKIKQKIAEIKDSMAQNVKVFGEGYANLLV